MSFIYSLVRGNLVGDVKDIHDRYGEIVRLAPNELSFAREDAWHDIFAYRPGHLPFPKNPIWFHPPAGQPHNIVTIPDEGDHTRIRHLLNHAFSEKSLKAQEPVIESYADLLISRLKEEVSASQNTTSSAVIDLIDWYHYITFDIVGDLAVGESFNCLRDKELHPWIAMIFNYIKTMTLATSARFYPWIEYILMKVLVPHSVLQQAKDHYQLALDRIHHRMNLEKQRPDFMTPVLERNEGADAMSMSEIESTFAILIIAGSETVGTTLAGITNALIQNLDLLRRLTAEILTVFSAEDQITIASTRDLAYLTAVINEGLRMCNPVPAGLPRVVPPGGDTVAGHWLPENTNVSVHPWTLYYSPALFHDADTFRPERWLSPEQGRPAEFSNDGLSAVRPFGLGPRSCLGKNIGMAEMRLILARLIWTFELCPPQGKEGWKPVDWKKLKTFFVVEKVPVWVELKRR